MLKIMLFRNVLPVCKENLNRLLVKCVSVKTVTKRNVMSRAVGCTDIVWMDLEMSGLDIDTDKILEISCLITDKDLELKSEGPCLAIKHSKELFENMNDWCKKHHHQSGLVTKCLASEITQECAERLILEFLREHIPKGTCPLAGNSVYMDRLFLRKYMPAVDDYMHYRIIDVSTIKELSLRWNPSLFNGAPKKKFSHRSLDDIKDSIEELRYYKKMFFRCASDK